MKRTSAAVLGFRVVLLGLGILVLLPRVAQATTYTASTYYVGFDLINSGILDNAFNPPNSVLSLAPVTAACPAVGTETNCRIFINITPTGGVAITENTTQPFYDSGGGGGGDDRMVGISNNWNRTIFALTITGTNLFAFETNGNDAPCTGPAPQATGCGAVGTNNVYAGPSIFFTNVSANTGTINFAGGLAPGVATTTSKFFWGVEGTTAASFVSFVDTPEPATYGMVGLALAGLGLLKFRRRKRS